MKTFCCISAVLFFAVVSVYADFEATGIIVPGSDYINFEKGIWLNHFPSGKKTKISSVIPSHVVFSPDGKKIAYQLGNKLYTMNNDGSGVKGPLTDLYHFQWTDRGIIFFRGPPSGLRAKLSSWYLSRSSINSFVRRFTWKSIIPPAETPTFL